MADSNITKRALALAERAMKTTPFSKISVGDICEKCEMNRKSFYYHFKDKYDLINWIYSTEFISNTRIKYMIVNGILLKIHVHTFMIIVIFIKKLF